MPKSSSGFTPRNSRLVLEYLAIDAVRLAARNPRKHPPGQIKALASSIKAFGFNVPILVDNDNLLISGHARVEAAKQIGMTELPAARLEHLSPTQLQAFMLADNKLAEAASWDQRIVGEIFLGLSAVNLDFEIEATGFSAIEIDMSIEAFKDEGEGIDDEDPLPPPGPAVTKLGDVYRLGQHRLMCASALDPAAWPVLMGTAKADLVVTDPPYNVPIQGHVSGLGQHQHREFVMASGEMDEAEFIAFLTQAMTNAKAYSVAGSVHYWAMDWRHWFELISSSRNVYDRHLNTCVWAKTAAGMGSFYRSQHEFFAVFSHGKAPHRNNIQLGRSVVTDPIFGHTPALIALVAKAKRVTPWHGIRR